MDEVLHVDGERFEVTRDASQPGAYHLRWASGPDPDYGVSVRGSDHAAIPREELERMARDLLRQVDRRTGHLED